MSNLSLFIGLPVGILGFLFLFWRRLKEDYSANQIFSFAFLTLGFLLLGFFLGLFLSHTILIPAYRSIFSASGLWFWGAFLFTCIGFQLAFIKFKLRFFETMEATAIGFIFLIFTLCIVSSIAKVDLKLLLFSLSVAALLPLFSFLDSKYKSFSWYKSGKIGFSGLTILAIFFLLRALVALINPSMLSFVGKLDAIVDSLVAFAFFITLYNLSGEI